MTTEGLSPYSTTMKCIISLNVLVVSLFVSFTPAAAYVGLCCGKCGGNMPLAFPGSGVPETHEWRYKLTQSHMAMDGLRKNGSDIALSDDPYMMQPKSMDMDMSMFGVGYTPTTRWMFMMMANYTQNSMPMSNGTTMKSEGMGDIKLFAKHLLWADDILFPTTQWSLLTGVSMPTGSIDERNDRNGDLLPYSMQLGSGTFDPIVGIQYSGKTNPWWYGGTVHYTGRLYDNHKGYRLGDKLDYNFFLIRQFRKDMLAELLLEGNYTGNLQGQARDIKNGDGKMMGNFMSNRYDPDNYGGNEAWVSAGFQWQPESLLSQRPEIIDVNVGVPAYQNKNGYQMDSEWKVSFSYYVEIPTPASRRWGSFGGGESDSPDSSDRGGSGNELGF
jgi:hypothetical protein